MKTVLNEKMNISILYRQNGIFYVQLLIKSLEN